MADSYPDASDSLALLLTLWGYDARVAYSGAEALLLARTFRPHVAMLKLRLGGLDGCTLAGRLRWELSPAITLVALTGYGDALHRRRAKDAGFQHHLVKPVEPEHVRRVLEAAVPAEQGIRARFV